MNQRQEQEQREHEHRVGQQQPGGPLQQPGGPLQQPGGSLQGVGDYEAENKKNQDRERERKATQNDLEEQTGNPGHRGLNPNRGATHGPDPVDVDPRDGPVSINEPPGSRVMPDPKPEPTRPSAQQQRDDDHGKHDHNKRK